MTPDPAPNPTPTWVHLLQGECHVTGDSQIAITTTLGSCVAACIRDPVALVGGMNHFLLPECGDSDDSASLRYGANAMELLVNGLLRAGARRERLEAKLFGGARLADGLADIGAQNAAFARNYLSRECIALLGGSLRGRHARRIQFWPVSGRVRQLALAAAPKASAARIPAGAGSVELF